MHKGEKHGALKTIPEIRRRPRGRLNRIRSVPKPDEEMTEQENRFLAFSSLDESSARAIARWTYNPPYDIYNFRPEALEENIQYLSDPANGIFGIRTGSGELIGFCSFGMDAQVPGGSYAAAALDVGLEIRPDLTGAGRGAGIIDEVLAFAEREYRPARFRVTIASFNIRARKAWEKAGFTEAAEFARTGDGRKFVILVKFAGP
jgi:[ribosomal protein S18]-alanine N-acetyltransferase